MKLQLFPLISVVNCDLFNFDFFNDDFQFFGGNNNQEAIDYAEQLEKKIINVRHQIERAQHEITEDLRQKSPASYSGLMCWACKAENMEQCIEKGEIEICDVVEDSCGLEERRWSGILVGLELGCKSRKQCHYDITDNFIIDTNQCSPTELGHSVCRQCCGSDICNRGWNIRSESGWQYDYLS